MRHYGHRWISFIWRGDIQWVQSNLFRAPRFYGIALGWIGIGLTVWGRVPEPTPSTAGAEGEQGLDREGGVQGGDDGRT